MKISMKKIVLGLGVVAGSVYVVHKLIKGEASDVAEAVVENAETVVETAKEAVSK